MPADNTKMIRAVVGYARVSTKTQGLSGLGLEAQRKAIQDYAARLGVPVLEIVEEVESGRKDRPGLSKAMDRCELTGAALVAARIDRFGRRANDLLALRDASYPVVACDTPNADGFLFGVLALVAEKEAIAISERTTAALAAAKARGVKLGTTATANLRNRELGSQRGVETRARRADARAAKLAPVIDELRQAGATSLRDLARGLDERGITPPRGGTWKAQQVARVLERVS